MTSALSSAQHSAAIDLPLVLFTTDAPSQPSAGMLALEAVRGPDRPVHDVVELPDPAGHDPSIRGPVALNVEVWRSTKPGAIPAFRLRGLDGN